MKRDVRKSFIVVGLGKFGYSVAVELESLRGEVLAIDVNEDEVRKVASKVTRCAVCDASSLTALRELGLEGVTDGIIAIGDDLQASILTLMNLKELGVERVVVRLSDKAYQPIFERLGANKFVIPEEASGSTLAHSLIARNVSDYYEIGAKHSIVRLKVGENFVPKTLIELNSRNKYEVNIIGVFRGNTFNIPYGSDSIYPGDELLIVGKNEKLTRFDYFINRI